MYKSARNRHYFHGMVTGFVAAFAVIFIINNVIIPWPYREELQACLKDARALVLQEEIEKAEDVCFQTYPHFN